MAANLPNGQQLVSFPLANDVPWYDFTIGLSAVQYTLRFRYNTRMQRWIMDIADAQNNDIIDSIPLLILRNLTGRFVANTSVPPGTFIATDDTNTDSQPGRYAFGTTHTFWYLDPTATS